MPTNYAFGAGRIAQIRPASAGAISPSLSPLTTSRINNTAPSKIVARASATSSPLQSSDPTISNQRSQNASANLFGQNATATRQAIEQKKQAAEEARRKAEEEAKRKAAEEEARKKAEETARIQAQQQQYGYSGQMPNTGATGARAQLISAAESLLGTPYAWGGGGYGVRSSRGVGMGTQNVIGVDCSGLTSYAYSTLGIRLPRTARQQGTIGYRTAVRNLQPGDLVVYTNGKHVMMYLGNGQVIESPKPGGRVRIRSLGNESVFGVHINLPGE